jgi:hypothetical protein
MPITTTDLAAAAAELQLYCRQCGRIVVLHPVALVRRHGPHADVVEIVRRLRCARDGMMPDAAIVFDPTIVNREAARRRINQHAPELRLFERGREGEGCAGDSDNELYPR